MVHAHFLQLILKRVFVFHQQTLFLAQNAIGLLVLLVLNWRAVFALWFRPLKQRVVLLQGLSVLDFDENPREASQENHTQQKHDHISQCNVASIWKFADFRKDVTNRHERYKSPIVSFQKMIVNVDWRVVRTPYSYDNKIAHTEPQGELQTISERGDEHLQDHEKLYQEVIQQINQHIQRVVVCPINVMVVVLKLFNHWHRHPRPFILTHLVSTVFSVRGKHFIAVNGESRKQNALEDEWRLSLYFLDGRVVDGFLRGDFEDGVEETSQVEHHQIGEHEMIVHPLGRTTQLYVSISATLLSGHQEGVQCPVFAKDADCVSDKND